MRDTFKFKALSATRLEAMIDHAVAQKQELGSRGPAMGQVLAFPLRPLAWGGMAALAASIFLAITLMPTPDSASNSVSDGNAASLADFVVLDGLGS